MPSTFPTLHEIKWHLCWEIQFKILLI
jgi:hypothetical protein